MSILVNECKKSVFTVKSLSFFLCLILFDIFLLFQKTENELPYHALYKTAWSELQKMSDDERLAYVNRRYSEFSEANINHINDKYRYEKPMSEIEKKSEEENDLLFSLYSGLKGKADQNSKYTELINRTLAPESPLDRLSESTPYMEAEKEKLRRVFKKFEGRSIKFENTMAAEQLYHWHVSDVLTGLLLFLLSFKLFFEEKERGLLALLHTMRYGRARLFTAKTAVLALASFSVTVIFFALELLLQTALFGNFDPNMPIQTAAVFSSSALDLSFFAYAALYIVFKSLAWILLSLVFALTSQFISSRPACAISVLAWLSGFYILRKCLPALGAADWLRYINPIYFLNPDRYFGYFFCINFFGFPVSACSFIPAAMFTALLLLFFFNIAAFSLRSPLCSGKKELKRVAFRIHSSLFRHECYKLFVLHKGILVLVIFCISEIMLFIFSQSRLPVFEASYRKYCREFSGKAPQELHLTIESENLRFKELHERYQQSETELLSGKITPADADQLRRSISDELSSENSFRRAEALAHYLSNMTGNEHIHPERIRLYYDSGLRELVGLGRESVSRENLAALISMAAFLIIIPLFTADIESGTEDLLATMPGGRKKLKSLRTGLAFVVMGIFLIVSYFFPFLSVLRRYGKDGLFSAGLYIFPEWEGAFKFLPVWLYLVIVNLTRVIIMFSLVLIIKRMAKILKSRLKLSCIIAFILGLPLYFSVIGIEAADRFSLNAVLSVNRVLLFSPYMLTVFPLAAGMVFLLLLFAEIRRA